MESVDGALDRLGETRDQVAGTLRLTMTRQAYEAVIRPVLAGFTARHPAVVVEVMIDYAMIALIPRRIADGWSDRVQVVEPPLAIPGFTVACVWHDRTTNHPAQRWLRERLATLPAEG